jgi:hypothetical protein
MQQQREYGHLGSPLTGDVLAKTYSIGSTRVHVSHYPALQIGGAS